MKALCLVINGETSAEILEKLKMFVDDFPKIHDNNMISENYEFDIFTSNTDRIYTSNIINGDFIDYVDMNDKN